MKEVQTLLAQYVGQGSEQAFKEIVDRYINFVYGTARRCVGGDAHLAQDVTQTVFEHLAQKAHTLPGNVLLGGWLHRDTCHVAATVTRGERRRQNRERQAMETSSIEDHSEVNLAQIAPVLDEAIDQLGPEDRTAILLRFFEQRDFRSVGEAMGSSENAAQKRVSRALEELRVLLKHRGVALSTTALLGALTTEAMAVAPPGLAAIAAGTALANVVSSSTGSTGVLVKTLATSKLSSAVVAVLVIASVGAPLLIQLQAQARFRETDAHLRLQSVQLEKLMADVQSLSNLLARSDKPNVLAASQFRELLRLRGEVGRLRSQEKELAQLNSTISTNSDAVSREAVWAQRVDHVKQWLQANPAENIPELKLLNDRDWLNSMGSTLDSAEDYSKSLSLVRGNAELRVMDRLQSALRRYARDNNGQIAADLSQLTPFLDPSIDQSILQRYELVPSTQLVSELQGYGDWVITQKAPVNEALDSRFAAGLKAGGMADERNTNRWVVGP